MKKICRYTGEECRNCPLNCYAEVSEKREETLPNCPLGFSLVSYIKPDGRVPDCWVKYIGVCRSAVANAKA